MAEGAEIERATRNTPPHVRRGSWWQSADGRRTMVVIEVWHDRLSQDQNHEYEISERGQFQNRRVAGRLFWADIQAGRLKEIFE